MRTITLCIAFITMLTASAQKNYDAAVREHAWNGTINGTIPVHVTLECRAADGLIAGEITYVKSKTPVPILLIGHFYEDDPWTFHLTEYLPDGSISGAFSVDIIRDGTAQGTWNNYRGKEYSINLTDTIPFPETHGGKLQHASFANLKGQYGYNYEHEIKGQMGRSITITPRTNNSIQWEFSVYDPNIAEGSGTAKYANGKFSGRVSDCAYTFDAECFDEFVVVKTTSGDGDYDCFGAFTTFEAIYPRKTK